MNRELLAFQKIKDQGLLPLFYYHDTRICMEIVLALYEAGIRTIEFTNRGPAAYEIFKSLISERNSSMPDLLLGVGTVKSGKEAKSFIEFGADFLVSPYFDADVARIAGNYNMLWIPGCMTPTEIHFAQISGFHLLKIFPGNVLGTGYLDAIRPLFNGLDLIVTGGVETTEENIKGWFSSGASALAIGSKLITKEILVKEDYNGLKRKTRELLALVQGILNPLKSV